MNPIEDLFYPLTIVKMRYGGKYVAFKVEADCQTVLDVQLGEEAMYDTRAYIERAYFGPYGIGDTISEALEDMRSRL